MRRAFQNKTHERETYRKVEGDFRRKNYGGDFMLTLKSV